jgi:hypothetical protein
MNQSAISQAEEFFVTSSRALDAVTSVAISYFITAH